MKPISRLDFIRRLRKFEFDGPYPGKRHIFMIRGSLCLQIPNPHPGDINVWLIKEVLRKARISDAEWESVK
ncbi:MAG: hypothetical protein FJY65_12875 [Calditrichaeota bacterium]|nr:hypothetical protein [Calditrichota bacterium]